MATSRRVWLSPIVGPLGTAAGLVLAMVIFMLLERRDLRDRLIGLLGTASSPSPDTKGRPPHRLVLFWTA